LCADGAATPVKGRQRFGNVARQHLAEAGSGRQETPHVRRTGGWQPRQSPAQNGKDVREAGFEDNAIAEVVAHVALNSFTDYFNQVARTEIDFPTNR
jgi:hypothetical protein